MDLPFLMLVLLLTGIGVIMVFSASYATAYLQEDKSPTFYFFLPSPLCRGWPDRDVYHLEDQLPDLPLAVGLRPWAGCPAAHRGAHPRHPHQPFRRREAVDRRTGHRNLPAVGDRQGGRHHVLFRPAVQAEHGEAAPPLPPQPAQRCGGLSGPHRLSGTGALWTHPAADCGPDDAGAPHVGHNPDSGRRGGGAFCRRHQALLVCRRPARP